MERASLEPLVVRPVSLFAPLPQTFSRAREQTGGPASGVGATAAVLTALAWSATAPGCAAATPEGEGNASVEDGRAGSWEARGSDELQPARAIAPRRGSRRVLIGP